MKELFNKLSNVSNFFSEKRYAYQEAPEGPKAQPKSKEAQMSPDKQKSKSEVADDLDVEVTKTKEGKTIMKFKKPFVIVARLGLSKLVQTKESKSKSALGKLIDKVKLPGKPKYSGSQKNLDKARVAFILKNLDKFKPHLKGIVEAGEAKVTTKRKPRLTASALKKASENLRNEQDKVRQDRSKVRKSLASLRGSLLRTRGIDARYAQKISTSIKYHAETVRLSKGLNKALDYTNEMKKVAKNSTNLESFQTKMQIVNAKFNVFG